MKKTYAEKLRDPRWQKKRLEVLERASFECGECGAKDKELHVHHRYYEKGKAPWEYDEEALLCVCEECHKKAAAAELSLQKSLSLLPHNYVSVVTGMVKAILGGYGPFGIEITCGDELEGFAQYHGLDAEMVAKEILQDSMVSSEFLYWCNIRNISDGEKQHTGIATARIIIDVLEHNGVTLELGVGGKVGVKGSTADKKWSMQIVEENKLAIRAVLGARKFYDAKD